MAENTFPFLPLTRADLEDPSLFKLNQLLRLIAGQLVGVQGITGTSTFRSTVVAKKMKVSGAEPPTEPDDVLTLGVAEQLFSPNAVREAFARREWRGVPVRPIPRGAVEPAVKPDPIRPIANEAFLIKEQIEDGEKVTFKIKYDPPDPIGPFVGVAAYIEAPSGSGEVYFTGNHDYDGDPAAGGEERYGSAVLVLPQPWNNDEQWKIYLSSRSAEYTVPLDLSTTPSREVTVHRRLADVQPINGEPFLIDEVAEDGTNVTIRLRYDPPSPIGSFIGIAAFIRAPADSDNIYFTGDHDYNGNRDGQGAERYGSATLILPQPSNEDQDWLIYLVPRSWLIRTTLDKDHTPNRPIHVHRRTEPGVGIEPPDVEPFGEAIATRGELWGFHGRIAFHTSADNYEQLAGVEINFHGPLDANGQETPNTGPHIMGVLEAPAPGQGDVLVPWTSDFWLRPPQRDYYRVRYTKINSVGGRFKNQPYESDLLEVLPLSELPIPQVTFFDAGTANDDGSFTHEMYWDTRRPGWMLIDWAAYAPTTQDNWSGVSVWIETPDGLQHNATGFLDAGNFTIDEATGLLYLRGTIVVEPQNVPAQPQTWKIICVSHNALEREARDEAGKVTGRYVQLQTLTSQLAAQVTNFTAQRQRGPNTQDGQETWYLTGSYTIPDDPLWSMVRITFQWTDETTETVLGDFWPAEGQTVGTWRTDAWPVPKSERNAWVRAYSVNHVGQVNRNNPPVVNLTIGPTIGLPGREYAPLVSGAWANVHVEATDTTNVNSPGAGHVFWFEFGWASDPSDPDYGGCVVVVQRQDGSRADLTGLLRRSDVPATTDRWPLKETQQFVLWFVSARNNDLRNSIVDGVTPKVVLTATFPGIGTIKGPRIVDIPIAAFAAGIRPVALVSSLPSLPDPNYPPGTYAFNTVERKLYRVNQYGNGWDAGVNTGDIAANAITAGLIAAGAISSYHLNAVEIAVGGGGNKPGRFGVYDGYGSMIGWIGSYGSYFGGWFKQLYVGGSSPEYAPLVADQYGKVSLTVQTTGIKVVLDPNDIYSPFRVYEPYSPTNEVRITTNAIELGPYGLVGTTPKVRLGRSDYQSEVLVNTLGTLSASLQATTTSVILRVNRTNVLRYFEVLLDNDSASWMSLANMGIRLTQNGTDWYVGITDTVSYQKPGGSTGTLQFLRGICVAAT